MTFSVRPATIDDLDTLLDFVLAEAREAEGDNKVPDTVREGIRAGLEYPNVARYWVLLNEQDEVVASISIIQEWSDWHAGYYWWIQSMFIRPEYRGQGLMKPLLAAIKQAAQDEQALELRLYVHQDNQRAIKAYVREGFDSSVYKIMTMDLTS